MTEWLPIDSAPKDGTTIILGTASGHVAFGKWLDNSRTAHPWQGWSTNIGPFGENARYPITHWMPLPDPPVVSEIIETPATFKDWRALQA